MHDTFFQNFSAGLTLQAFFHYYYESLWLCEQNFLYKLLQHKKIQNYSAIWKKEGMQTILDMAFHLIPEEANRICQIIQEMNKIVFKCKECNLYFQKYTFSLPECCPVCKSKNLEKKFYPEIPYTGDPFFQMRLVTKECNEPDWMFLMLGNYIEKDCITLAYEIKKLIEKFFSCACQITGQEKRLSAWYFEFRKNIHELCWLFLQKVIVKACQENPDWDASVVEKAIEKQQNAFKKGQFLDILDILQDKIEVKTIVALLHTLGIDFVSCCGNIYITFPFFQPLSCPLCNKNLEICQNLSSLPGIKNILFSDSVIFPVPRKEDFLFYKQRPGYIPEFCVTETEFRKSYESQIQESKKGWQIYQAMDQILAEIFFEAQNISQKTQDISEKESLQNIQKLSQSVREDNSLFSIDTQYIKAMTDLEISQKILDSQLETQIDMQVSIHKKTQDILDSLEKCKNIHESVAQAKQSLKESRSLQDSDAFMKSFDNIGNVESIYDSFSKASHSIQECEKYLQQKESFRSTTDSDAMMESFNHIGSIDSIYDSFGRTIPPKSDSQKQTEISHSPETIESKPISEKRDKSILDTYTQTIEIIKNNQRKVLKKITLPLQEWDYQYRFSSPKASQKLSSRITAFLCISMLGISCVLFWFLAAFPFSPSSSEKKVSHPPHGQNYTAPEHPKVSQPNINQDNTQDTSLDTKKNFPSAPTETKGNTGKIILKVNLPPKDMKNFKMIAESSDNKYSTNKKTGNFFILEVLEDLYSVRLENQTGFRWIFPDMVLVKSHSYIEIDMPMSLLGSLQGKLTGLNINKDSKYSLTLTHIESGQTIQQNIALSSEGEFSLVSLQPGEYDIFLKAKSQGSILSRRIQIFPEIESHCEFQEHQGKLEGRCDPSNTMIQISLKEIVSGEEDMLNDISMIQILPKDRGSFSFPGIKPGKYMVLAETPTQIASQTTTVSENFACSPLELNLNKSFTLSIQILYQNSILSDAKVYAISQPYGEIARSSTTDTKGMAVFSKILPGAYLLSVRSHTPKLSLYKKLEIPSSSQDLFIITMD